MSQTVIYYIVTMILTKELVIATDQCTKYQFKSPFFPGVSCEDIYNKNPESHDRLGYYWILDGPSRVYCGVNYTGSSCEDIFNNNPETVDKSGYYRINDNQWTYCNMTAIIIANNDFISTWRRMEKNFTCFSANFSTNGPGISYQRVCGRARGYQKRAFYGF